jgi:hypothetical protein
VDAVFEPFDKTTRPASQSQRTTALGAKVGAFRIVSATLGTIHLTTRKNIKTLKHYETEELLNSLCSLCRSGGPFIVNGVPKEGHHSSMNIFGHSDCNLNDTARQRSDLRKP